MDLCKPYGDLQGLLRASFSLCYAPLGRSSAYQLCINMKARIIEFVHGDLGLAVCIVIPDDNEEFIELTSDNNNHD